MHPERLLMAAYYRRRGEDRVTEVFATVLQGVPAYIAQLADRAGLPRADSYEVQTQVSAPGCVVDLEIRAKDPDGRLEWMLWSEHKVHAAFSERQITKLSTELNNRANTASRRLITITLHEPSEKARAEAKACDVLMLRWRGIVAASERAGIDVGGPGWRTSALERREGRLLLEWQTFCAHELEEIAVEPLSSRQVEILAEVQPAFDTVEHLLESGVRTGCEAVNAGPPREKSDYWYATPPDSSWPTAHGCMLYAKYDSDDSLTATASGVPVFLAGMWAEGESADALRKDSEWLLKLSEQGFNVWEEGAGRATYLDVARVLAMDAVASETSLEAQESLIARLCEAAFRDLIAAEPQREPTETI